MTDTKAHAPDHSFIQLLLALVFGRGRQSARLRLALCMLSLFSYWILLVLLTKTPPSGRVENIALGFLTALLAQLGRVFFSSNVLRHLLPVIAGCWLAFRVATQYLDSQYDFGAHALSARTLRLAMFGGRYETLEIRDGDWGKIPNEHPLVRIGGPGFLNIHLGFAALVETEGGKIQVLGPCQGQFLRGFEKLIDVIDLREQSRYTGMIRALTRDGIEVRADDVQMVYRVHSGDQPRGRTVPFPFETSAVERLIHHQPVTSPGHHAWDHNLENSIRREIARFMRDSSLQELLAMSAVPRAESSPSGADTARSIAFHIPHRQLTQRFLSPPVQRRLRKAGIDLDLIRVGRWEIAGCSADTKARSSLLPIWQDMQQAGLQASVHALDTLRSEHRSAYMKSILSRWIELGQEILDKGDTKRIDLFRGIVSSLELIQREAVADPGYKLPPATDQVLKMLRNCCHEQTATGADEV